MYIYKLVSVCGRVFYVQTYIYLCISLSFSRKNFGACLVTLNNYSINLLELCYYTHKISPSNQTHYKILNIFMQNKLLYYFLPSFYASKKKIATIIIVVTVSLS